MYKLYLIQIVIDIYQAKLSSFTLHTFLMYSSFYKFLTILIVGKLDHLNLTFLKISCIIQTFYSSWY